MGPLETGSVSLSNVRPNPNILVLKLLHDLLDRHEHLGPLLRAELGRQSARNYDDLQWRDPGRGDHPLVVSVRHDHHSNRPRRQSPRVLPHVEDLARLVGVLDLDVEHLGEVLAKAVRGGGLDSSSGGGDEALDGGGEEASGELLVLGLDALDHGDGEQLLVDSAVEIEDLVDLNLGLGLGEEGGVTLLPEELSGSEEGFYEAGGRRSAKVASEERGSWTNGGS